MATDPLQSLRERTMSLHDEAIALRQYQVAYHMLAAVLHAGEALHDLQTMDLVESRAREHADWLSRNAPTHPLSAQSAASRGHQSVFEQLAVTAAAARARMKAENLTRR
jgi:hypothetical protein